VTRASVHPIETESFAILRSRIDLSHLPPLTRAVTERVIHSSADLEYATDLHMAEAQLRSAQEALRQGAPVVADVQMVAAGITTRDVVCRVRQATSASTRRWSSACRSASSGRRRARRRCATAACPRSPTSPRRAAPPSPRQP
jgi:precorrin-8X/cobalt-precorrin-8 methylmutase